MISILDRVVKLRRDQMPSITPQNRLALLFEHVIASKGHSWNAVMRDPGKFNDIVGLFAAKPLFQQEIYSLDDDLELFRAAIEKAKV